MFSVLLQSMHSHRIPHEAPTEMHTDIKKNCKTSNFCDTHHSFMTLYCIVLTTFMTLYCTVLTTFMTLYCIVLTTFMTLYCIVLTTFMTLYCIVLTTCFYKKRKKRSNQECRIAYRHSHSRVSQCLASIRKLGNRRSSEGLRSFKSSKGTNLFILIILAGDIEMNPGSRFQCGLCKKYCKASDRLLECEECEKRFHASCSNLSDNELLRIESGDGAWYCTNCKADCGLCSGAVLKGHKAVRCDSCDMWIHNECSFIAETQYEIVNNTNCAWICPKCEFFNFSDSCFGEQVNLETENRFVPLTKEKKDRSSPCGTNKSSFISGLKFISININSIRGKKLELLAFLDFHQPHVVAIQETKIESSVATSELSGNLPI